MKYLGNPKTIGFISLSILSNVLVAQNNIPSFLNDEEATAYISPKHHYGTEGNYINSHDHDTVCYLIVVDATDHLDNEKVESTGTKTAAPSMNPINLEKDMELDVVTAINSIFHHHSILFDYNDAKLTHSSMKVLDKVAYVVLNHPDVVFEIGAHTDARGVYADNMVLSKKRLDAAIKYLTDKGIDKKQLVGVAYGEQILKNVCDSDSHCSEEVHAGNRRLEIRVISINK